MATAEDCLWQSPVGLLCLPGACRWTTGVRRHTGEDRRTQLQQPERTWTVSSLPGPLLPRQGSGSRRGGTGLSGAHSQIAAKRDAAPSPQAPLPFSAVASAPTCVDSISEPGPGWMVDVRPEGKPAEIPFPLCCLCPSPHAGLCVFNFPPIFHLPTI